MDTLDPEGRIKLRRAGLEALDEGIECGEELLLLPSGQVIPIAPEPGRLFVRGHAAALLSLHPLVKRPHEGLIAVVLDATARGDLPLSLQLASKPSWIPEPALVRVSLFSFRG